MLNSEKIAKNLMEANQLVNDNTIDSIDRASRLLEKLEEIDSKYVKTSEELKNIYYEIQETSRDIYSLKEDTEYDPYEMQEIERRFERKN